MSASIAGRGLRSGQRTLLRTPGTTLQPLLTDAAPIVFGASGLGTGGGAGIDHGSGPAYGIVRCTIGLAPATTGIIQLQFVSVVPAARAPLWAAAEWAAIAVTLQGGTVYALTWTRTRPLIPGELAFIAYQWTNLA